MILTSSTSRHLVTTTVPLCLCLLLGACAGTPGGLGGNSGPQYSGFLSDYSRLQPVVDDPTAMAWLDSTVDFSKYNKVLLERIQVALSNDGNDYRAIDPTELTVLTDYFHDALVRELSGRYPVVSDAGPGVLRVRIAITELVPTKPEASVIMTAVPYASLGELALGAVEGGETDPLGYLGNTGIEAAFLDGQTNQVIAQFVDHRAGQKVVVDTSEGLSSAIDTGVSSYTDAFLTWGYAKQAFDFWAKRLRNTLDRLHQTT